MSIGKNVKMYRKQRKLTQHELAEKATLSRSYLADLEADRYNPSVDTLKTIADALQIRVHELLDEGNEQMLSPREERDIATKLESMMSELESDVALSFHGEPMDEEERELLRISLENSLRLSRQMAKKKFTPNKYRN
ncbi:helix-turn-helix domain-containing protein [Cohnella silvisoli]|uniref:Helix-turn-helix domain-containing protein n=1 Tax=Cohnella silvisoli TaxID=2873699 RepID=A0ABV1L2W3_9BACL|nr:helix-turn-helix domain-containing protein [Cohnella silvisoli]MCD9026013.1 helix-turn-helix domain-containing protein [Cohnella silvisoli]